jgi:hypothetical protein
MLKYTPSIRWKLTMIESFAIMKQLEKKGQVEKTEAHTHKHTNTFAPKNRSRITYFNKKEGNSAKHET